MSLFVLKTNRDVPHAQTHTRIHNFTLMIPREDEWDFGRGEMGITNFLLYILFCYLVYFGWTSMCASKIVTFLIKVTWYM